MTGHSDEIPEPALVSAPSHSRQLVERRWGVFVLSIACLLTIAAYSNSLRGEFVYDDQFEIVKNPLIQQPSLFLKAITSDVWAFKGDRGQAWSNYWRPLFVTWMAVNYQLFGLKVIGWHVANLAAHLAVVVLLYFVLKELRIRPVVRLMTVWMFAVHPVLVESVAWASGIPNMLMSGFIFGSYICYLRWRRFGGVWVIPALVLYAMSLLSKEGMVVYPAIIFLTEWAALPRSGSRARVNWGRAARHAALFAMVMIAFVAVRYSILGTMRRLPPGAPGWAGALATVPSVLCFYLQKAIWPYPLGMAYGSRVVSNANINWMNFWLPVVALAVIVRGVLYVLPRDRAYRVGLIWFLISILLALDVRVFLPEEIVHDRYLYLPLCGVVLMLSQLIYDAMRRIGKGSARGLSMAVAGALAAVLAVLTYQQNPTWANEVALWEQAVKTDPTSAHASAQYGEALRQAGKLSQARSELERSLTLNPDLRTSNLALGMLAVAEKRFIEAERLLRHVLEALPRENVARENLASCLQQQGRVSEAIGLFDEGRKLLPYLNETYTINIAVLERNRGNADEAIRELASIEEQMGRSLDPAVIRGLFFQGELYREAGMTAQASRAYAAFVRQARESRSSELEPIRDAVEAALRGMPAQP